MATAALPLSLFARARVLSVSVSEAAEQVSSMFCHLGNSLERIDKVRQRTGEQASNKQRQPSIPARVRRTWASRRPNGAHAPASARTDQRPKAWTGRASRRPIRPQELEPGEVERGGTQSDLGSSQERARARRKPSDLESSHSRELGRDAGATQAGRVRRRRDAGKSGRSAAGRDAVRQVEQSAGATQTSRATQRPARRGRHLAWRGRCPARRG